MICILLLAMSFQNYAQMPLRCDIPIPDHVFRQKQKSVAIQPTEELKLKFAASVAVNHCLSVDQVKVIAALFIDDLRRLEFAKTAWHNTVDKENFYFVYDDFAYFSTVFMLHDYIKTVEAHPMDPLPPVEPEVNLSFPPLDYPLCQNYSGPVNCNHPITEAEFINHAVQVALAGSEANKLLLLMQIGRNQCLCVSQLMKLATLLASEPDRLSFMKAVCFSVYDPGNLPFGAQLFAHIPNKAAYNDFIGKPLVDPVTPPPCSVGSDDFAQIRESIEKESFNSTRFTLAKQIIRAKQCFTARQVTDIMRIFSFDDTRLELAKYAWDYTIDRENYFRVTDALTFSSSKEDLMKFLEGK